MIHEEELYTFIAYIQDNISKHPDWVRHAINAICDGQAQHINQLKERVSQIDAAFLCALALAKPRLRKDVLDLLNETIVSKIKNQTATCQLEDNFLKNVGDKE